MKSSLFDPYRPPNWARRVPAKRGGEMCECEELPVVAAYEVDLVSDGVRMGERVAGRKMAKVRTVRTTVRLCWACLIEERRQRGEISYKEAERLADLVRAEYIPPAPRPAAIKHASIKAASKQVERVARKKPTLTARDVESNQVPVHTARLALLLAEADGMLTLTPRGGEAVYTT